MDDYAFPELAAIEPDVILAETVGQRREEQKVLIELVDLEVKTARLRVPEHGKQAVRGLHVGTEVVNGRSGFGVSGKQESGRKNHSKQKNRAET